MAILPLKLNKETSEVQADILLDVAKKNWISVLGESSIKILLLFNAQHRGGDAILGDYSFISEKTGLARASVSKGLSELEAFGFIVFVRIINKKTKLYNLNQNICYLSERWVLFFKNKNYKKFCVDMLLGVDIDNSVFDKMQLDFNNSTDDNIKGTLGRLLMLFIQKSGFTIEDLLEEERTEMEEDILFPGGFGFGIEGEDDNWQSILTPEEKKCDGLMKIAECYVEFVGYPTRKDIDLMKEAYALCYPFEVKNAIKTIKMHPKYGERFTSFAYIIGRLRSGVYGTREKNKAKVDFKAENKKNIKKANNQTNMGFKTVELSRTEIIDKLKNEAVSVNDIENEENMSFEEQAFDFGLFKK